MAFNIEFLKNVPEFNDKGHHASWGVITLGSFDERFLAHTDCWTEVKYEVAWLEAVDLILAGSPTSALVTDAHDPATGGVTTIWPMWRIRETIVVQNRILLPERAPRPLSLHNIVARVGNRETLNDEGQHISEWPITIRELRAFRERRAKSHNR